MLHAKFVGQRVSDIRWRTQVLTPSAPQEYMVDDVDLLQQLDEINALHNGIINEVDQQGNVVSTIDKR